MSLVRIVGLVLSIVSGICAFATVRAQEPPSRPAGAMLLCEQLLTPVFGTQWRELDPELEALFAASTSVEGREIIQNLKQRLYDLVHQSGRTKDVQTLKQLREDMRRIGEIFKAGRDRQMLRITGAENIRRFIETRAMTIDSKKIVSRDYAKKDLKLDAAILSAIVTTGALYLGPTIAESIGPVLTSMGYVVTLTLANGTAFMKYLRNTQRSAEAPKIDFIMKEVSGQGSYWGEKSAHIGRDFGMQSLDIFYSLKRDGEPVLDIVYWWSNGRTGG